MAKISLNDAAPSEEPITFLLANEEIKLGGDADASYDTDDLGVLANAEVHPWLTIEYPEPPSSEPDEWEDARREASLEAAERPPTVTAVPHYDQETHE